MPVSRADLHIHTRVSDGLASVRQTVDHVAALGDLDLIAITDHEDATGGHRAREYAAKRNLSLEVIVGAEVTTMQGHLVALGIESAPRSFRSIESTLYEIHRQGGLAIVPHPMSWMTRSLSRRTIDRICAAGEPGVTFDAIELANPSPAGKATRTKALAANRHWGLAAVGASDAHHLPHVGAGWTEFDGAGESGLRSAIEAHATVPRMQSYAPAREVGYRNLALGLAWGYAATPRKMLRPLLGARR